MIESTILGYPLDLQTYIKILSGTNKIADINVCPERREYLCGLMDRDLSEQDRAFANAVISTSTQTNTPN